MKVLVFIVVGIAIGYFVFSNRQQTTEITETGDFERLGKLVTKLQNSGNDMAVLIVRKIDSNEFFQITANETKSQIDFPLITEGQIALGNSVRDSANRNNFPIHETSGSDGSKFLDIEITGNPEETTKALIVLMKEVFNTKRSSQIEFKYWGF